MVLVNWYLKMVVSIVVGSSTMIYFMKYPKNKNIYEGYFRDFQPHGRAAYISGKRKLVGDYNNGNPTKGF